MEFMQIFRKAFGKITVEEMASMDLHEAQIGLFKAQNSLEHAQHAVSLFSARIERLGPQKGKK